MPIVLPQVEQPRPQETAQKERRRPSVRQIVRSERLAQQGRRRGASVGGIVEQVRDTGPKLPFRTTLPGYCQGAGMRGVSPDRKQAGGVNAWSGAVSGYDFKLIVTSTG